jgi:NAD(P)-dependent dehydrogenase (short-subunit alcohol dehydrogenase family)
MHTLQDKVVIITGASSGIGHAAALLFAREGARVVVGARRERELAALVDRIASEGGTAAALAGDVADEGYAQALVELAEARFGGLDIAFDNAGTLGPMAPTTEVSAADWDATMRVNLGSAFFGAKHQIPAMVRRGGGSIVFTSTFVGHTAGMPNVAAYAASKAGIIGLTLALAVEVASKGVRVNALLPGGTDTAMGRVFASTPEARAFVDGLHALKRIAAPDEIAAAALFLASPAASFVTGTAMLVDGGVSINRT